jgi:hypothetical protein
MPITESEKAYFFLGLAMLVMGLWHAFTATATTWFARNGRDHYRMRIQGDEIILIGWMQAAFGLFMVVSGLQLMQNVQPNLIDAVYRVVTLIKLKLPKGGMGVVLIVVYIGLTILPYLTASFFGEQIIDD